MKRLAFFSYYLLFSLLLNYCLFAEQEKPRGKVDVRYWSISDAELDDDAFPNSKMSYSQGEYTLSYIHHFHCKEAGLVLGGGQSFTTVNWSDNPAFQNDDFKYNNINLGLFYNEVCDWQMATEFQASFDPDESDWSHYTLYRLALSGIYTYCEDSEFHVGLIAFTGMRNTKVIPIIGTSFYWRDCWKVSLIVPLDMSFAYCVSDSLEVGLGYHWFWDRHRVHKDDLTPMAVFDFRETALEAFAKWQPRRNIKTKVYAGSSAGGDLKVMDSKGLNPTHYAVKGTFMAGAEATVYF